MSLIDEAMTREILRCGMLNLRPISVCERSL